MLEAGNCAGLSLGLPLGLSLWVAGEEGGQGA